MKIISMLITELLMMLQASSLYAKQIACYVTFSGESKALINNIKQLSLNGKMKGNVLPSNIQMHDLRNMRFGRDNNLYVVNAYKKD